MKFNTSTFMALLASAALSTTAFAQDAEMAEEAPAPAEESADSGLVISGFVDTSFSFESVNSSKPTSFGFGIDQVEIDLEKNWDNVGLRFDIEAGADYGTGTGADFFVGLEQGYLTWAPSDAITLTMGRFLAPIGWELLDPNEMYQFSHAHVFNYGIATAHTGLMLSAVAGDMFDISVYFTNASDTFYEVDIPKALGTRIGLTFGDANVGLSAIYDHKAATIIDIDATYAADSLTIGFEGNVGIDDASGDIWAGSLLMANFGLTDEVALTIRGDYFFDPATVDRVGAGLAVDEQYISGTVSPSYAITDNAGMLLEYKATYRVDASQIDHLTALEATYSF